MLLLLKYVCASLSEIARLSQISKGNKRFEDNDECISLSAQEKALHHMTTLPTKYVWHKSLRWMIRQWWTYCVPLSVVHNRDMAKLRKDLLKMSHLHWKCHRLQRYFPKVFHLSWTYLVVFLVPQLKNLNKLILSVLTKEECSPWYQYLFRNIVNHLCISDRTSTFSDPKKVQASELPCGMVWNQQWNGK